MKHIQFFLGGRDYIVSLTLYIQVLQRGHGRLEGHHDFQFIFYDFGPYFFVVFGFLECD